MDIKHQQLKNNLRQQTKRYSFHKLVSWTSWKNCNRTRRTLLNRNTQTSNIKLFNSWKHSRILWIICWRIPIILYLSHRYKKLNDLCLKLSNYSLIRKRSYKNYCPSKPKEQEPKFWSWKRDFISRPWMKRNLSAKREN